jgi:NNP family nitrate/nitrite transporter-like MFS transporter
VPLALIAAVLAFLFMDNLREAKADPQHTLRALEHGNTWLMALLYIGTFGSFIGYSAAFPTLLKVVFDRADIALTWGFLGALVGSLSRPYGGKLADKMGGSVITFCCFLAMACAGYVAVLGVQQKNLVLFFASFIMLFVFTGLGNGSAYRMIPSIFKRLQSLKGNESSESTLEYKRQAAGAVGIIAAVGAFGGFAIPFVYKWSKESFGSIVPALQFYIGVFLVMAALTWFFYLRKSSKMQHV